MAGRDRPINHLLGGRRFGEGQGINIVHGHSSHHPRPIEVYGLYGCGDLIHDYEGIAGYEAFRNELALMYFAAVDPWAGRLTGLRMAPMRIRKMRLNDASSAEAAWLQGTIDRISQPFGSQVELTDDGSLRLRWEARGGDATWAAA